MARRWVTVDTANYLLPELVLDASLSSYDVSRAGILGNGSDEGAALNAVLTDHAGEIVVIPTGFNIGTTVPINVPSGVTLKGYGAKLTNNCPGTGDRLLRMIGVSGVVIEGLELDGDKASFATTTEQRHNVWMENADNITFRGVHSHDAKGDGFYVGDNNTSANYCTHIRMEGCTADLNHRNGLSVIAVDDFKATDCDFINQTGTNPQAGVDIEPNSGSTVCNNVKFVNCTMTGNVGCGVGVTMHNTPTALQGSISFTNCEMSDNTDATLGSGLRVRNPTDVRIIGCQLRSNAAEGAYVDQTGSFVGKGLKFIGCDIEANGLEGVQVFNVADIKWIGCGINDNSQVSANARDGLSITPTATTAGFEVIGCGFTGTSQRNGIRTGSNAQKVTLIGNQYGTVGTANVSLADQQGSRFRLEQDGTMLSNTSAGQIALRFRENADTNDRVLLRTDGELRWGDGSAAPDTRLWRNGADQLRTEDAFILGTNLQVGTATAAGTGYAQFFEQTADPAAGATNTARLFAKDNGSGKTQLVVRFPTGATQVIATEP